MILPYIPLFAGLCVIFYIIGLQCRDMRRSKEHRSDEANSETKPFISQNADSDSSSDDARPVRRQIPS
jgi:hypothetical protein